MIKKIEGDSIMLKEEKELFLVSEFGERINDKDICKLSIQDLKDEDYKIIIAHAINDTDPYKHTNIYKLKDKITDLSFLKITSTDLIENQLNKDVFNNWFKRLISRLEEEIPELKNYPIGMKQKLINMVLKYIFCFTNEDEECYFEFCHMPLDSYIYEDWFKNDVMQYCKNNNKNNFRYKKELPDCWSKIDNIDTYLWIQETINNFIVKKSKSLFEQKLTPLQAEFYLWPFLKCRRAKTELEKQYKKYYNSCLNSLKNDLYISINNIINEENKKQFV